MAIVFPNSDVLLTVAELQKRLKNRQEWLGQIAVLEKQVEETEEWLNHVAKVIDPERAKQLIGDAPPPRQVEVSNETTPPTVRQRPGGVTWTGFIEDYVNSASRPVDYADLREAVSKSILGSNLEKSEKGFYGAIRKLTERLRIVKEDGWIFSVASYNEYKLKVSKGEVERLPPSSSEQHARGSRIGDEIKRFMTTQTNGATSRQIIDHLLQIPEFQKVVERNETNVYNVLPRLVKRNELRKIGTTFYSPEASPSENTSSEETAVSEESSEAPPSSLASRNPEPTHTDVGRDQDGSGGPLTSTAYVGPDLDGVPPEPPSAGSSSANSLFQTDPVAVPPQVPSAQSLNPDASAEAPPKNTTRRLFAEISAKAPPQNTTRPLVFAEISAEAPPLNTTPLLFGVPTEAQPEVRPAQSPLTRSSPTESLFEKDSPAVAPKDYIQPMDHGGED